MTQCILKKQFWFLAIALPFFAPVDAWAQGDKPAKAVITKETQAAIDAGLAYLAKEQAEDGSWGTGAFKGNVGVTGLAGLAFLAGDHRSGKAPHANVVARAVDFILSMEDQGQPGFFTSASATHGPMYGHGYAVLFLAEAHAMLPDKKKQEVNAAVARGVQVILGAQNKDGGWRYRPQPVDADITVTCCQLQALVAAKAAGIDVPREALDKGQRYILSCQDLANTGGFRYQTFGGAPGFARSAAAVSALQITGLDKGDALDKGLKYMRRFKPGADGAKLDVAMHYSFGHYYAAQAMARAGGKPWQEWYAAIRDDLLRANGDRQENGSWTGAPALTPHYSTAMALLILQTPSGRVRGIK